MPLPALTRCHPGHHLNPVGRAYGMSMHRLGTSQHGVLLRHHISFPQSPIPSTIVGRARPLRNPQQTVPGHTMHPTPYLLQATPWRRRLRSDAVRRKVTRWIAVPILVVGLLVCQSVQKQAQRSQGNRRPVEQWTAGEEDARSVLVRGLRSLLSPLLLNCLLFAGSAARS